MVKQNMMDRKKDAEKISEIISGFYTQPGTRIIIYNNNTKRHIVGI